MKEGLHTGLAEVSMEKVLDGIPTSWSSISNPANIYGDPKWQSITAVKNKMVFNSRWEILSGIGRPRNRRFSTRCGSPKRHTRNDSRTSIWSRRSRDSIGRSWFQLTDRRGRNHAGAKYGINSCGRAKKKTSALPQMEISAPLSKDQNQEYVLADRRSFRSF